MKTRSEFPARLLELLRTSGGLAIRAGRRHRFIGIWHVVVNDRLYVRSWSVSNSGWYRAFLKEPRGTIRVKKLRAAVVARRARSGALRDLVDRAYLGKYKTPGARKYAKDLCSAKSRATTLELVPGAAPDRARS
jgi:hypothetical protein